ncbi:MAG: hypothetical protein QM564_04700 [Bergeyella sp.]
METTKQKTAKKTTEKETKKVSKTWLAFLELAKDKGRITDMKAVLK